MTARPWPSAARHAILAVLATALCMPAASSAAPHATLNAALHPEHLGATTTIKFAIAITYGQEAPTPLTSLKLLYPKGLGIGTSGLGLRTCHTSPLELQGPSGCPANSIMGYGTGLAEVPFGASVLQENVRLTTFMAPQREGHFDLLFYAIAPGPIAAEVIFNGTVQPAPTPYGGDLVTTVPLVPVLPEAPDAALVTFSTTIGPEHITYWEYTHGQRIPYHPRGILLPTHCPRDGFQFAASFTFQNGAHAHAHAVVPCPRAAERDHHRQTPRSDDLPD